MAKNISTKNITKESAKSAHSTQHGAIKDKTQTKINEHLRNIYKTKELEEMAAIRNFRIVQKEKNRLLSNHCKNCNRCHFGNSLENQKQNDRPGVAANQWKI